MKQIDFLRMHSNRSFLVPFPPTLFKEDQMSEEKGYTLKPEEGLLHFVLPIQLQFYRKLMNYYERTDEVEKAIFFFSCLWRFSEATYAERMIELLHEWAFQAQDELQTDAESYSPPQGVIDYHWTNFVIRIRSSLDSLACWLNQVFGLGFSDIKIHYLHNDLETRIREQDPILADLYHDSRKWVEKLNKYRRQITHRSYGLIFPVGTKQKAFWRQPLVIVPPEKFSLDLDRIFQDPQIQEWKDIREFCKEYRVLTQDLLQSIIDHLHQTRDTY